VVYPSPELDLLHSAKRRNWISGDLGRSREILVDEIAEIPGPINGTCLGMMVADDFHGISPVQILIMILPSGKRLQKTMDNYYF
jgi:hypothetical protein